MRILQMLKKNKAEIAKKPHAEYDWRAEQFKIINIILEKNETARCIICEARENGLLVKVEKMYAYLPFQFAPWQYPSKKNWKLVGNSLKGRCVFDCKIVSAEQESSKRYKILVDARMQKFGDFKPQPDCRLNGIVLKKTETGWYVEVGGHFGWKHGSILGFFNIPKCYAPDFTEDYIEGEKIHLYYIGKGARGFDFINGKLYDVCKKYVGTRTSLLVIKEENSAKLLIDNNFYAFCEDKITEYIVNQLNVNAIIDVDIVGYNALNGFAVRHAYHDSVEHISWNSFILQKYIGRTDLAKDETYRGIMVKKFSGGVFVDIGRHFDWEHGSIIGRLNKDFFCDIEEFNKCKVGDLISVTYNTPGIEQALNFWDAKYFYLRNKYVGKILPVSVYTIANTLTLLLEDKYKTTLKKKKAEKNIFAHNKNGDTIYCEVLDYTPFRGFVVKNIIEYTDEKIV